MRKKRNIFPKKKEKNPRKYPNTLLKQRKRIYLIKKFKAIAIKMQIELGKRLDEYRTKTKN